MKAAQTKTRFINMVLASDGLNVACLAYAPTKTEAKKSKNIKVEQHYVRYPLTWSQAQDLIFNWLSRSLPDNPKPMFKWHGEPRFK